MPQNPVTIADLARILRESAGTAENVDLEGDILDVTFTDLGYDSIALLEASSRLEREYGVRMDDEAIAAAQTPRDLLVLANDGGSR